MSLITKILANKFPLGPYARFQKANVDPAKAQAKVLRTLLKRAASTQFGQRYDFDRLSKQEDVITAYQQSLPLAKDEDFRADFERMMHLEPDVLWPGTCSYAAISGGTTSNGLLCPISQDRIEDDKSFGLASVISYLADAGNISCLKGKILTLSGGVQPTPDYPGLLTGEISGVLTHYTLRKKPNATPRWMAVSPSQLLNKDWDEKIDTLVELAMKQDVRMLVCAPSWGLVMLRRLIERYQQEHDPKVRTVGEIWPNLQLVVAGAVPLKAYQPELEEIIALPQIDFRETYGATQGFLAFQESGADSALSLWLQGGVFFEFVPWEDFGHPNARRYSVRDIEPNVLYVPHLTTCTGLWSYCLDDIVRFSSVKPPRLFVVGRTTEMLCTMGEAVMREEVQNSLEIAARNASAHAVEYFLSPLPANAGKQHSHQLIVEFTHPASDMNRYANDFDAALQEQNANYRKWRQEQGFGKTEVVSVPPGTFQRYLKTSRSELRFQSKMPRLGSDRRMANEILQQGREIQSDRKMVH